MSCFLNIRSSRQEESCNKVFLTFLQNSLKNIKNTHEAVFNLKFQAERFTIFLKKRFPHICFPKNFAEVLRTPILQNANWLLLLKHSRMRISCFLVLKFWQILWKNTCKRFHLCDNTAGYKIIRAVVCVFGLIANLLRFSW